MTLHRRGRLSTAITVVLLGCSDDAPESPGSAADLRATATTESAPPALAPPRAIEDRVKEAAAALSRAPAAPANSPGDPTYPTAANLAHAREQIAATQFRAAIATLETSIAAGPETAEQRTLLGICRSNDRQDLAGARREFERAWALDPRNADAILYLSELQTAVTGQEDARVLAEVALLADPDHARAQVMVAELRRQAGELESANDLIERHLAEHPDSGAGYAERGAIRLKQGRTDDAVADLRRAIELDPVDTSARWSLATALRRAGEAEEAEVAREDFLLLKAIFSESKHDLEPDVARRQDILGRLIERFPDLWQARLERARLLGSTRGHPAAVVELRAAVAEFPDVVSLRAHLAAYLEAIGDADGAAAQRAEVRRLEGAEEAPR